MTMPILTLQKRARELGRIRIGQKGDKGQPQKLDRFRVTSPAKHIIEKVAELYGGTAREWTPAGGTQQWEVITEATRIPIMVPPQPVTQFLETWSAAGCIHRCDGETDYLTGDPCDTESREHQEARPTTRLNVVMRDVEGVGVFRLESHGWNAAVELPQAAEFLAAAGGYINGWVSLEERVSKAIVNDKPLTRKFMVPIIEIDVTPAELMAGKGRVAAPSMVGGPVGETPALSAAGPDYVALAADLVDAEEIRDLWRQAHRAGHMTQGLNDYLQRRVEDLNGAAGGDVGGEAGEGSVGGSSPASDAAEVVDGEIVEGDEDRIWHQIEATAGNLDWSQSKLLDDFSNRMGMPAEVAAAAELRAYLDLIAAEVPAA